MGGRDIQFSDDREWGEMKAQITKLFTIAISNSRGTFDKADMKLRKTPTNSFEFISTKFQAEGSPEIEFTKDQFDRLEDGPKREMLTSLNAIGQKVSEVYLRANPSQPGASQTQSNLPENIDVSVNSNEPRNVNSAAIQAAQDHYNRQTGPKPTGNIFHQVANEIESLPKFQGRELKYKDGFSEIDVESGLRKEYANDFIKKANEQKESAKFAAIHTELKNIFAKDKVKLNKIRSEHYDIFLKDLDITEFDLNEALKADGNIADVKKEDFIKLYGYYVQDGGNIINETLFLNSFTGKHPTWYHYAIVDSDGTITNYSDNHFDATKCLFYQKPGIKIESNLGENCLLGICGNGPGMNNWDLKSIKVLSPSDGNKWSLDLDPNTAPFEYKFVRINTSNGEKKWELRDENRNYSLNRVIQAPSFEVVEDSVPRVANKRIQIHHDVGPGNSLWISGNGPGMSWDNPTELRYEDGKWVYPFEASATTAFDYKFLRGPYNGRGETWERGIEGNRRYEPSASNTIDITYLSF